MPLFIGGPLDGRLIQVEDSREHVEVATEMAIHEQPTIVKPNKLTDIFYYKKQTLECPGLSVPIFVPRSYSCQDVIESLIEGYHQGAIQNIQN